jgi:hypothetical protein
VFGTLGSGLLGLLNPMKLVTAAAVAQRAAKACPEKHKKISHHLNRSL